MAGVWGKVLGVVTGVAGATTATALPVAPVVNVIGGLLDRVLPDKAQNDAAKAALGQMALSGELAEVQGQLAINLAEAQSKSTWVAGWRPAFGWVGAVALAYEMVMRPLLTLTVHLFGATWAAPSIELQDLIALCSTMLGFGTMRSVDKATGTSSGH